MTSWWPAMRARYHGQREQRVEDAAGALRDRRPFRTAAPRAADAVAGELLQQLDGEHVRRAARHGDDVGAERIGRQRGGDPEGVEHVAHRRRAARRSSAAGRRTSACRCVELADQHRDPFLFRGVFVRSEVPGARDPGHRLGVPRRFLAEVERRQRRAERGDAAKDVGEAARGDQRVAGRDERAMAEAAAAPRGRRRRGAGASPPIGVAVLAARSGPRRARASRAAAPRRSRSSAR